MKSRISFTVAGIVIAALTSAHAGEALQVVAEDTAETAVAPEVAAQAGPVGPDKPVLVINPPELPVPVDGQVRVVNTPNVNVVNPVQVVQVARKPINNSSTMGIQDGEYFGSATAFTVPEGKQFVLTHASLASAEASKVGLRLEIINGGGFVAIHDVPATRSGALILGESDAWVASLATEIYVPAGQKVGCSVMREQSSGVASGRCTVSGYLVDAPE